MSLRLPPRKYYLYVPGWKVPEWVMDPRPSKDADDDWRKGFGRFTSFAFVIRESDKVTVYLAGVDCGATFLVDRNTILWGSPTWWCIDYLLPFAAHGVEPVKWKFFDE
jgi:hypothetical protein